jgi:aconitase B
VSNKRQGGVVLGGKIAPIFFNMVEDSDALPIEFPVEKLTMGDVIVVLSPMRLRSKQNPVNCSLSSA